MQHECHSMHFQGLVELSGAKLIMGSDFSGLCSAQLPFGFAYFVKKLLIVVGNVFFHQVIHIHIGGLKGFGVGEIAPALGSAPEHS